MMLLYYVPIMFLILPIAFFSIWQIRMRVSLKRSPITCNVIGPFSDAIIEQLLYSEHLNQALHLLFLQLTESALQLAKHVFSLFSRFMFKFSSNDTIIITLKPKMYGVNFV